MLAAAADEVVVVSTPEPTSLADAPRRDRPVPAAAGSLGCACWSTRPRSHCRGSGVLDWIVDFEPAVQGAVVSPLGPGFVRVDPARADGGAEPASVRDGVSGGSRLARRAAHWPGHLVQTSDQPPAAQAVASAFSQARGRATARLVGHRWQPEGSGRDIATTCG